MRATSRPVVSEAYWIGPTRPCPGIGDPGAPRGRSTPSKPVETTTRFDRCKRHAVGGNEAGGSSPPVSSVGCAGFKGFRNRNHPAWDVHLLHRRLSLCAVQRSCPTRETQPCPTATRFRHPGNLDTARGDPTRATRRRGQKNQPAAGGRAAPCLSLEGPAQEAGALCKECTEARL